VCGGGRKGRLAPCRVQRCCCAPGLFARQVGWMLAAVVLPSLPGTARISIRRE
jgi:hypothetical protein